MKKLAIVLVVLASAAALGACSSPAKKTAVSAEQRCADKVARALTSPDAVVEGAVACMAPKLAKSFAFKTDADVQAYASEPPVLAIDKECGKTAVLALLPLGDNFYAPPRQATAYLYVVHVAGHADLVGWQTLIVADGKVAGIELIAADFAGCP